MSITKAEEIAREAVRISAERGIDDKVEIAKLAAELSLSIDLVSENMMLRDLIQELCALDVKGHSLASRLQFSLTGRALLEKIERATTPKSTGQEAA